MPEKLKLKLVSPAGSPAAVYSWPLQISDTHNEAIEIVDTIRWVCKDFPDLQLAVDNNILSDFDPNDYESMKQLCDKYNKAITNIRKLWSGREPPPCINSPPSVPLLKHIMNQVYNHAIANPEDLNQYEPFSPEVYGETTFELVDHIIRKVNLGEDDIFVDLGSGVGNVVLQVASTVNCKECIGIEKAEIPSSYAQEMEKKFLKWTAWYGKSYGDFELLKGDFLSDEFNAIINRATVIFANNYVFGPTINHQLKLKFANLPDNCRIVSSREFCPLNFRITDRNLDDIGSMMRVTKLSLPGAANSVSWTNKPISFYLHVVDRSKLEEYFRRQKYPEEYPSSSTPSPDGEQDETLSDNPLDHTFKSSITTDDTSDEDFDAGRYSTPQGKKELELNRLSIHKKHKARLARQRKLHPIPLKRSISIGMQKSRSVVESAKRQQKRVAKARGVQQSSRRFLNNLGNTLDLFREQMISYVQDMSQPQYTESLQRSIEKEELRNKYLHMVMANLDSEVKELSSSTVDTMKQCMAKLGMTEFTPAGLLEGAKAIVTHNRELRNNVQQLEQSVNELQIRQFSLQRSCNDGEKRTTCVDVDRSLLPSVAMDTGHGNGSSLHIESHDPSPASSISRDLDILTSPASNIVSPTILSPRRGQSKSKHSSSSKKELEIAEILSMLGSSPTKILVAQPVRIELERPQLYSDLESCTVSIERVKQEFRHCVAPLPQEDTTRSSHVNENPLPVNDVEKRNDSLTDSPLASTITLPTNLTLALPTMLPPWSTKNDSTSAHKPWNHTQKADKVLDKPVSESRPLDVFAPRVFNNNINKEPPLVPTPALYHGRSGSYTATSTTVGPSSSTHVTTSIVDPAVPTVLPSSQYATNSKPPPPATTAVTTTTTMSSSIPRSISNKLIIGGLSSNDTLQATTTTATTTYMPIHHLPFSFISNASAPGTDTVSSGRYMSVPSSIINPMAPSYPMSSAHVQQPHIIGARPLMMETEEDRIMLRKSHHKKRNRSSAEIASIDTLPQVNNPEHVVTPTRSQAAISVDLTMPRILPPSMMPTNLPSSSISNDTSAATTQPDLTKTPLLAYPYQPGFLPYMLGRPMMPTWLDMQQRLNPTSTIRPPIYPSLMQSSPLIGFDPTGTLFKPQSQFPTNLLSSPFLPAVSFGNNMDPSSLQQPPMRPFIPSNPATPTSTLSPTTHSSSLPIITKESPLLHSSFTNLSVFGGSNSSIGANRAAVTPPMVTSAEISPSRSGIAGPWSFPTQMSPMMGFGLTPTKFGSGSNQSSPLLGLPHTLLPGNNSPLVISQLGNLATDGGSKKDNNTMATNSHPLPDAKHSRRHHHHPPKEQLPDKNDPKHKPGVITFVGHKPSTSTSSIANTSSSNTSNSPLTQSDCYVVPSPGSSATTAGNFNVTTTSSFAVTGDHQLAPRPPTSAYMQQNEMMAPAVLPFQSLVSKMLVKKPRNKKQGKPATENKDGSPKRPGRRGRKATATTSMPSIITPSVVEKLAGTSLLNVIAPSGLDVGDLPGNKKEAKQSKETLHLATLVVTEHAAKQRPSKSANNNDLQAPTSSSQPLGEVNTSVSDASPAKLDSACSLLTLSQAVPTTLDGGHKMAAQSPVIITDKGDDSGALAQARRPSSVTAAEAMLMFTNNTADEKNKTPEKTVALPLPVAKSQTDEGNKPTEASDEDVIIVVQDEPQVKETDDASREEPVSEEKFKEKSKEDCEANCSTAMLPIQSSSNDETQPTNTREEGMSEGNHIVSETNHTEVQDTVAATDNVDVDTNSVSEEVVSNVKDSDLVSEDVLLQNTEYPSAVDNDGTEVCNVIASDQINTPSDTNNDTCGDKKSDTYSDIKNDTKSDTQSDAYSDTKNDACSEAKNDTCSNTKNERCSDTRNDTGSGDTKNDTSNGTKNDTCIDTRNDTCGNTKDDTCSDKKNDTYSDTQDDTTIDMNQLAVAEVEISVDNADDDDDDDNGDEVTVEESSENHPMMEEQSAVKDHADANSDVDVQDSVITDGTGDTKSNWEEVSDDELLDADLTPPLAKKSKRDDDQVNNKPSLTLNLPQTEDTGNNVTVSSEASTPLLDDNIVPARQISVSSCISLYDDAMFEGDTFEPSAVSSVETVNGDTCENGVDDSVMVDNASKSDSASKIKQINPTIMARRRYRTQSIDSEGSSYGKESRRDTSNTLTLPDGRQERNKSASPRRKLQPDSTTSPKDLESDYKDSLHSPADRSEWHSRPHKSRERGRNPRKQPLLHKNYGDHCDRQQGGNPRYAQNADYRSSGRPNSTWSNSHYKHSSNNNYNNQHYPHWSTQQQNYSSEQDSRRSGNFGKRHAPHYRQDSNKNNRNPGRESSQWNKRDYHGRKLEGCDSAGYRGNSMKFQHHSDMSTGGHHYNNRGALSVHSHYTSQSGRHGDRSYEQISDEEPSSTAAGFKHQLATGILSISEASNSAVSDNSNSGSGSDSELESNHSSASRPVSRASSVKSSSSRSNKERLYTRKEPSSQRSRHHPYHHSKHNSTGYNSRRH